MQPVLTFVIGDRLFAVASYSTMLYLGAATIIGLGLLMAVRRGLSLWPSLACLLAMAVSVPVGARLLNAVTDPGEGYANPATIFTLDFNGFSLYGGLLLAAAVGLIGCRLLALDVVRLADAVAPGLGLGLGIMRVGCFLAGCCYGVRTDLPWGVVYPAGSNAHLHQLAGGIGVFSLKVLPVHPTQLYETAGGVAGALLAAWLLHRRTVDGTPFLAFIIWFSAVRWLNWGFRVHPTGGAPEWFYPGLYTCIILTCLWLLLRRYPPSPLHGFLRGSPVPALRPELARPAEEHVHFAANPGTIAPAYWPADAPAGASPSEASPHDPGPVGGRKR